MSKLRQLLTRLVLVSSPAALLLLETAGIRQP
jgi:hypothetical protein